MMESFSSQAHFTILVAQHKTDILLAPGRYDSNFKSILSQQVLQIEFMNTFSEIEHR